MKNALYIFSDSGLNFQALCSPLRLNRSCRSKRQYTSRYRHFHLPIQASVPNRICCCILIYFSASKTRDWQFWSFRLNWLENLLIVCWSSVIRWSYVYLWNGYNYSGPQNCNISGLLYMVVGVCSRAFSHSKDGYPGKRNDSNSIINNCSTYWRYSDPADNVWI